MRWHVSRNSKASGPVNAVGESKMSTKEVSRKSTKTPDSKSESTATKQQGSTKWTFLTNHSHVLVLIHSNPDVVLRQVALDVGITERAVQRIIQDLEAGGFIERERVGRRNRYSVLEDQPLRHPIESHRNIGDLLNLVAAETGS